MVKTKRVLCIVSSLDTGGAETFLMKIFRKLRPLYKMDFVVSAERGYYENEVRMLGGEIYRVPLRTKHPVKTYLAIRNIVKSKHYDNVLKLCDTPKGTLDTLAAKAGKAKKICVRSCNAASSENVLNKFIYMVLRPVLNSSTDVKIAPSDLAAVYTFGEKEYKNGNVTILHNAVDLDIFHYDADLRSKIRQEFGIREDVTVLGHIGRFCDQKNHAFLLDVFKNYNEKNLNAVLLLVGKGELEGNVREKAASLGILDKLIFTGVRSDVPALLSAMDAFVFPSFYEGMPNTVIEAQATGLPCLIADTITKEADITGLVQYLPLKDANEWADKIDACIEKQVNRTNVTDIKEIFIRQGYDIETVTRKFEQLVLE